MDESIGTSDARTPSASMGLSATERAFRDVARAAASLARFCERVEHNEPSEVGDVAAAGQWLRATAVELSAASGVSLRAEYERRIRAVEERSLLQMSQPGADELREAQTWRDVQAAQTLHDRLFHPDVFGLSRHDQLRHFTLHVTKLAGLLLDALESEPEASLELDRIADLAIFGVKLSSVLNEALPLQSVGEPENVTAGP